MSYIYLHILHHKIHLINHTTTQNIITNLFLVFCLNVQRSKKGDLLMLICRDIICCFKLSCFKDCITFKQKRLVSFDER